MTNKDAFDLWWEWADKPVDNKPTIDAAIYDAVMALPPDERRDREKVNAAVRDGLALGPERLPAQRTSTTFRRRRNDRSFALALLLSSTGCAWMWAEAVNQFSFEPYLPSGSQ
jgi:hypothetical protein